MRRILIAVFALCLAIAASPVASADDRNEGDDIDHVRPKLPVLNVSNGFFITPPSAGRTVTGPPPVTEGDICGFRITRTGPLDVASSTQWRTKDGTAVAADGDYTAVTATPETNVVFPRGKRSIIVQVFTHNVDQAENQLEAEEPSDASETFSIVLVRPHNVRIADGQGVCRIFEPRG